MIHVILFRPEIPQNTGNIGRLCACTNTRLHLIHPLGFSLSDRYIKRSGMDYWRYLDLKEYSHWEDFWHAQERPKRIWLLTTHAENDTQMWFSKMAMEYYSVAKGRVVQTLFMKH